MSGSESAIYVDPIFHTFMIITIFIEVILEIISK